MTAADRTLNTALPLTARDRKVLINAANIIGEFYDQKCECSDCTRGRNVALRLRTIAGLGKKRKGSKG